jgi:two-component sensor histidine kinase
MIPCGLILNELVTNSLKYAFPGEREGEIVVSLRCEDGSTVTLAVTDDGVGMPAATAAKGVESWGTRIVEILARQLNGSFDRQSAKGVDSTITFTRSGTTSGKV